MNERQEQTADVLGKLTVLGTIVLPMNIVTGMWGMNVLVPGQDVGNLNWFWCSKSRAVAYRVRKTLLTNLASQCWLADIRHLVFLHRKKGLWHRVSTFGGVGLMVVITLDWNRVHTLCA